MKTLRSLILVASLSWLFSLPAFAGSGTITVLDASSVSHTYDVVTDASSHFIGMGTVCDGTAAAQCAAVKAASTAAAATDPALVVAISPNNTVGATVASGGVASGAIASGAVASGAYASGAFAVGAGTDGWNATLGTKADAAWSSGSGTLIAIAKAIAGNTSAAVPACGSTPCTTIIGLISNDPCAGALKTNVAIATSSGNTQLVAGSSGKKVYICSAHVIGATAAVINIIEGTGAACTTANEAAIWGSTTAASGESYPANGGMTYGNGGGTVGVTATAANGVCLLQSGTAALAGNITFVQQ